MTEPWSYGLRLGIPDSYRPWLSVIIPTAGRDTLQRALESIRTQAPPDEVEILVIVDGNAVRLVEDFGSILKTGRPYGARTMPHDAGYSEWGHPQCQHGMGVALGQYLAFLGDDDEYLPGALEWMHRYVQQPAGLDMALFRVQMERRGDVVWDKPELREGYISGQCVLVRNQQDKLGTWRADGHWGDFAFIWSTIEKYTEGSQQRIDEQLDPILRKRMPFRFSWVDREIALSH